MKRYLLVFSVLVLFQHNIRAIENDQNESSANSFSIEQSNDNSGNSTLYSNLSLGNDYSSVWNVSYMDTASSLNSYGFGWMGSSDRGWKGFRYQYAGEKDNVETRNIELDFGLNRDTWSVSIRPRLNTIQVYTQIGPKSSTTIYSPGVAMDYTYRTKNWDWGVEGGINLYPKRLDTYANNSRLLLLFDPLALQMVSGLEKSYFLGRATRFQHWGDWGLQYINSISAIDFTPSHTVAVSSRIKLASDWDLNLSYLQSYYQQNISTSYALAVSTYW